MKALLAVVLLLAVIPASGAEGSYFAAQGNVNILNPKAMFMTGSGVVFLGGTLEGGVVISKYIAVGGRLLFQYATDYVDPFAIEAVVRGSYPVPDTDFIVGGIFSLNYSIWGDEYSGSIGTLFAATGEYRPPTGNVSTVVEIGYLIFNASIYDDFFGRMALSYGGISLRCGLKLNFRPSL